MCFPLEINGGMSGYFYGFTTLNFKEPSHSFRCPIQICLLRDSQLVFLGGEDCPAAHCYMASFSWVGILLVKN